jgi:uncharacterized protein YndB with AHSA1/START domain
VTDYGTFTEHDGRPAVRFQRSYPHPIQRVWSAITETEGLGHWFPAAVTMQQQAGGVVEFSGDPNIDPSIGKVLVFEPPRRLAYSWGGDELHFELEPVDEQHTTLTMINVLDAENTAARNAAGWTVCLAELDKHLAGQPTAGPHSDTAEPWQPHYDAYIAAGMPSGAEIPGTRVD